MSAVSLLGRAATVALRHHRGLRERLLRHAARRGQALVLCYHRVSPGSRQPSIVEPLHPDRLEEHLLALHRIGDIVPLRALVSGAGPRTRPQFAVTFDDDDPCHVEHALPVLMRVGAPATFFLSGRALHGLGPYWWSAIEHAVARDGLDATCRALGVATMSLEAMGRHFRTRGAAPIPPAGAGAPQMAASDIRALADAGMSIGFHTLHHPALTQLDDAGLQAALTAGREALGRAARQPIDLLAYPYGYADDRVAAAAARAGYRAAFSTTPRALSAASDRWLLPRWQPGAADARALIARAALRLAAPGRRSGRPPALEEAA